MKKQKISYVIIIFFSVALLIGCVLFDFSYRKNHSWNYIYIKVTNIYDRKQLCQVGDEYFYVNGTGIYTYGSDEPVLQTKEPLICSENDILYVYSGDTITGYTVDFEKIEEFESVGDLVAFSVANEKIITFDADKKLHIYNKNNMSEYDLPQDSVKLDNKTLAFFELDNMKIFECLEGRNLEGRKYSDGEFIFENGEKIFEYRRGYAHSVPCANEKYAIINSRLNASRNIMKFKYGNSKEKDLYLSEYCRGNPIDCILDNDTIISIISEADPSPHDDYFKEINNIENHFADVGIFVNADYMVVKKGFKTRKRERVIFVNKDIVMTFYNGEYITYSLDNFEKIGSQKADEIKTDNSYAFQSCGSYIFVFDDNTGEIINRIPVS